MRSLEEVIQKHWGYDTFRPLQREAMAAASEGRDSLVVLPTGGGKSLCYQAPALLSDQLTVVVSPLIALMKDQVDQLILRDITAAFLNSSLDLDDKRRVFAGLNRGEYKLIFVAPERFANDAFLRMLGDIDVGVFAIDEAHCISHWGHDFRADYRRLDQLKQRFPAASIHAFTATATPRVRDDIVEQLHLEEPDILVGDFFRPNLHYSTHRRTSKLAAVIQAVTERKAKAGIVYCIRRADVDELTLLLQDKGIRAEGYHAGMSDEERTRVQDAFAVGEADVIVATVAFGMGIDRSDIRYVIHAAMPKSIEHYQQETGRAGRDGEPAECILFYSGGDFHVWKSIIDHGETEQNEEPLRLLSEMYTYCTSVACRHRKLVSYFGQAWNRTTCAACDVCNGEIDVLPDSVEIAQKLLSCVVRTEERFGAGHVSDILMGKSTDKVADWGHDQLSTFGLIQDYPKPALMAWFDQLVDQGALVRDGEYRTLQLTRRGWEVLRAEGDVKLYAVQVSPKTKRTRTKRQSRKQAVPQPSSGTSQPGPLAVPGPLDADGRELFEMLRQLRKEIADEIERPAFIVFSDKTLREIARYKPTTENELLAIKGVGPAKWEAFGPRFIETIESHCAQ